MWISRRTFLAGALAAGGCSVLPGGISGGSSQSGFGSVFVAGSTDEIDLELAANGVSYRPEIRAYIVAVADEWRDPLKNATDPMIHGGVDAGYAVLFQTCSHLGCRVPECTESGQFECPCHGSLYGRLGEKRGGPAPRGMDRMPAWIEDGQLVIDSGVILFGTPIGTDLGEPLGPTCVEPAEQ